MLLGHDFNEKAGFIVALFAALIALNYYSIQFETISLLLGSFSYQLILIFNIMIFILFTSVYFYAIDYALEHKPNEWRIFSYPKKMGNFLYAVSLFVIPLAFIIHFISFGALMLTSLVKVYSEIFFIVMSSLSFIIGFISSLKISKSIGKRQKTESMKRIQNEEENIIAQAEELFKQGFYSSSLVELGKLIEIVLQKKLLSERDIDMRKYNVRQLIDISIKNKLIDFDTADKISMIRNMRNKAAHIDVEFSKKNAYMALKTTNEIMKKLDPKNKWN